MMRPQYTKPYYQTQQQHHICNQVKYQIIIIIIIIHRRRHRRESFYVPAVIQHIHVSSNSVCILYSFTRYQAD